MYRTIEELRELADANGSALWDPILKNECRILNIPEEEVFSRLNERYEIMLQSANRSLTGSIGTKSLVTGLAGCHYTYSLGEKSICGSFINRMMALALSCSEVNASMGKICAAPTAGSCGIIPAVLVSVGERFNLDRGEILKALLTASGIGAIITKNATVSGAEGGCQAECGVAAAMAAAAAVQMAGGTNMAATNAVCFALMNCMGLVCDPIAGLVQIPCAQRNASQAVNAVLSAELALAGMQSLIPPDEIIETMYKVGTMLPPELRETALGGIAATPTGKRIAARILE